LVIKLLFKQIAIQYFERGKYFHSVLQENSINHSLKKLTLLKKHIKLVQQEKIKLKYFSQTKCFMFGQWLRRLKSFLTWKKNPPSAERRLHDKQKIWPTSRD
jgi:hypothetical protein